jgi:hypothetical protein
MTFFRYTPAPSGTSVPNVNGIFIDGIVADATASLSIPTAYPDAFISFFPATSLYRWVRRRKLNRPGHCPARGYDLRAAPNRCPECGLVPEKVRVSRVLP